MKTIIITGAGSGIGQKTAQLLEQTDNDIHLVLIGRDKEKLKKTLMLLKNPIQHKILSVDIRNGQNLRNAFKEISLESKNLIALIANAGIGGENEYGVSDRWHEIIDTNLTGTYNLIMESLPFLNSSKQQFKNIIVVSSILAQIGVPGYSAYSASKAGLLGLTRSLAVELAPLKILVNAICPGWVRTEMSEAGILDLANSSGKSAQEVLAEQMSAIPLRKMSEAEEVGRLIRFLISNEQNSITGQTLNINNGAWM